MNREQFRDRLSQAEIRLPLLARLTGYDEGYVTTLGRDRPVGRHILTIVEAWYLMDGPKRQELLKAIGQ